jgi:hypothetical protein
MFKQVVFFFCLALLVFGGYQIYVTVAPPESKIRWTIEGACDAFNARSREECLAAFTSDYKDTSQSGDYEDHTIDKPLLQQGLEYMFTQRLEAETGDFLYMVEPRLQTLNIKMESESQAVAQLRLNLKLKMGHTWSDVWGVEVNARFRKAGRDWVISRSALRTVMGRRPWNWDY